MEPPPSPHSSCRARASPEPRVDDTTSPPSTHLWERGRSGHGRDTPQKYFSTRSATEAGTHEASDRGGSAQEFRGARRLCEGTYSSSLLEAQHHSRPARWVLPSGVSSTRRDEPQHSAFANASALIVVSDGGSIPTIRQELPYRNSRNTETRKNQCPARSGLSTTIPSGTMCFDLEAWRHAVSIIIKPRWRTSP